LESFAISPDMVIGRESNVSEDLDSWKESSDDGMFYGSLVPKQTGANISEFLKLPEHPSRMSNQHQKNILTSIEF